MTQLPWTGHDDPEVVIVGDRTDDFLAAITDTRPTLTDAMLDEFNEDIAMRTRL